MYDDQAGGKEAKLCVVEYGAEADLSEPSEADTTTSEAAEGKGHEAQLDIAERKVATKDTRCVACHQERADRRRSGQHDDANVMC